MHVSHGLCTAVTPENSTTSIQTGHVTRMSDDRLPKQLLYGELCYGKRSLGWQKKRFKDTLKKTLTSFNIDATKWEVCAQHRPLWRSMIHTGARTDAETNRIAEAQKKCAARKARLYSTTSTSAGPTYPCPECGRVLQARIGLIRHLRTHRSTKHDIIIEEVMVIIGNDGRTTLPVFRPGAQDSYHVKRAKMFDPMG